MLGRGLGFSVICLWIWWVMILFSFLCYVFDVYDCTFIFLLHLKILNSRVQADQRAGRAGRTRPGKCYRLYPSDIYLEEFLDATIPEIQRSSLAGSVLYLKSLDLPDMDILKFDFLDSPSRKDIWFCSFSTFIEIFNCFIWSNILIEASC